MIQEDFRLGILFSSEISEQLLELSSAYDISPEKFLSHMIEVIHNKRELISEIKGVIA